ncbi:MAG: type I restriction-modification system subunit M [Paludibacteraceae bacterium]|nr:type I restriction-modification system subunit M [Paludibacteraceae bacterium]
MAKTEKEELFKTIWAIADDLRGKVDGWDFKAYVLGTLFYRYISENITKYINHLQKEAGVVGFDYAKMEDTEAEDAREMIVAEKGFFILPSQLFSRVSEKAKNDSNLNETLANAFRAIEASAQGTESEDDLRGLFSDFIVDSAALGNSVIERNKTLAKVMRRIADLPLDGDYNNRRIDPFGDAYEYLMKMYAANAGKSGGEYFTPQEVSEVLARIASFDNDHIKDVYDPACGSGSLLLKFKKIVDPDNNRGLRYYGQEVNITTYNLCRINMFLHDINFSNFDIQLGDTLLDPKHIDLRFDAIVSNPPYSLKWIGKENPLLINNDRYSPAGVLAPQSAADLAFTMHMLYHLKETGTCAIVEFPGVLYRGGAEKTIRRYLVENNYVDTVIQLPANLFFGVGIATCIIVLRKSRKKDNNVLFVDASREFKKNGNKNILTEQNQNNIVNAYCERKEVRYFTRLVTISDILANESNLSVSSYVEQEDTREKIDIVAVNTEVHTVRLKGNSLAGEIERIIKEIDN